jgi:hypothetical protein
MDYLEIFQVFQMINCLLSRFANNCEVYSTGIINFSKISFSKNNIT